MDELKSNLNVYRAQLSQVEAAISSGQNDSELLSLQQEMKELIALTEDSLLAYEKSSMLSHLNKTENIPIATTQRTAVEDQAHLENADDLMASFYADINSCTSASDPLTLPRNTNSSTTCANSTAIPQDNSSDNESTYSSDSNDSLAYNDEFLRTIEDSDDVSGVKCQAPYQTDWTGRQFHNAMIMSVDEASDSDTKGSLFVRVLFLNPTLENMKPCPYFLDEKCRFGEADCKFSHGFRVSLYELRKFKEPDFSKFVLKSHCLAKHPSGVWHQATLVKIVENHQYEVQFTHQDLTATLDINDVLPLSRDHDISDSSESDDEDDDVVIAFNKKENKNSNSEDKLGKWEEHTNGFGSKMLLKFGYKMGEGLGVDKKGRVEPVPVVVLPPGKSLDHCMKIKEKKLGIVDNSTSSTHHRRKRLRHTVFNFLNRTLGDQRKNEDYLRKLLPKDSFGIKKEKLKSGQCKIKVELVKNDSKIKQLKDKIQKCEDSIARNRTRDPSVAKKQQVKLNEAIAELKTIQSNNKAIELHQNRADTHRKMTRF